MTSSAISSPAIPFSAMSETRLDAGVINLQAFAEEKEAWATLAREAIEPNPFYEPAFLLASAQHLERSGAISLLVIRDPLHGNRPVGLFPLGRPRLRDGILFGALSLYKNAYSSLSTPLVMADCAPAVLDAAFGFLATANTMPKVLHFGQLCESRAFVAALEASAVRLSLPLLATARFQRAAIETTLTYEHYQRLQASNTRKNLTRKQKLLAEKGMLAFTTIPGGTPEGTATLAAFLALEAKGWKGRHGTALASRATTRAFAEAAFCGGASGPRLFFEQLSIDGTPIAINLNLVSQGAAYTVKTAYDEDYAAYSPGALLDRRTAMLGASDGILDRVDSCAAPGHRIETIWRERETIATVLVGVSSVVTTEQLARIEARMTLAAHAIDSIKAVRARFCRKA